MSNTVREEVAPIDALKILAATLNNPSIIHERVELKDVYKAAAEIQDQAKWPPAKLALTPRDVAVEGLTYIMAQVFLWKPVFYDIVRGVRGTRISTKYKTLQSMVDPEKVVHRVRVPAHS